MADWFVCFSNHQLPRPHWVYYKWPLFLYVTVFSMKNSPPAYIDSYVVICAHPSIPKGFTTACLCIPLYATSTGHSPNHRNTSLSHHCHKFYYTHYSVEALWFLIVSDIRTLICWSILNGQHSDSIFFWICLMMISKQITMPISSFANIYCYTIGNAWFMRKLNSWYIQYIWRV